jgi:hypothetical protein
MLRLRCACYCCIAYENEIFGITCPFWHRIYQFILKRLNCDFFTKIPRLQNVFRGVSHSRLSYGMVR